MAKKTEWTVAELEELSPIELRELHRSIFYSQPPKNFSDAGIIKEIAAYTKTHGGPAHDSTARRARLHRALDAVLDAGGGVGRILISLTRLSGRTVLMHCVSKAVGVKFVVVRSESILRSKLVSV